jgi:hypothetical protein
MKKCLSIFFILAGLHFTAKAQQFVFGADVVLAQVLGIQMNKPLFLDSSLQSNTYFYIDHITQKTYQTDFPGPFIQWNTKNKIYFRLNGRISRTKVNVGSSHTDESRDTLLLNDNWTMLRPIVGFETGYMFGKKLNHIFVSAGATVSKLGFTNTVVKYYGYNDYDASNYYNYFVATPLFASVQGRIGIKRKILGLSMCYQHSVTKTDQGGYLKSTNWFGVELSIDIYRTAYKAPKQYKAVEEITGVNYKTHVDLKKSSSSTGLHLPLHLMILDTTYINAWSDSSSNYLVYINRAPEQRFFPEIYANHVRSLNKKHTVYGKQEYGLQLFTIIYRNAVRKSTANTLNPDLQNANDLVAISSDVKQRYFRGFYSFKWGYRHKVGRKSFVYGELGLRYSMNLKNFRDKTLVPYMNRNLFWSCGEFGIQMGHKGINMGLISVVNKIDNSGIYKNLHTFYIGIYHEISSK